jgi:hypothetical protein
MGQVLSGERHLAVNPREMTGGASRKPGPVGGELYISIVALLFFPNRWLKYFFL